MEEKYKRDKNFTWPTSKRRVFREMYYNIPEYKRVITHPTLFSQ